MEKCKRHCNALVSPAPAGETPARKFHSPAGESLEWKGYKYGNVLFCLWEKFNYCNYLQKKKKKNPLDLGTMAAIFKSKALYCQHYRHLFSRAWIEVGLSVPFGVPWEAGTANVPLKCPPSVLELDFSLFPEALNPDLVSKVTAQFKKARA